MAGSDGDFNDDSNEDSKDDSNEDSKDDSNGDARAEPGDKPGRILISFVLLVR